MNPSPNGRGEFAPLDFSDLTPIEFPFSYKGKKYVLCEASADAASKYRNALLKNAKPGPDGRLASYGEMAEAELVLVAGCLFEAYPDKDGAEKRRPVTVQQLREFPNRVTKPLFERAQKISELMPEKETREVLLKRISEASKKLNELNAAEEAARRADADSSGGAEDPAKNAPSATAPTS
jgi:hypothetical protein